jgi:hypothetical protein
VGFEHAPRRASSNHRTGTTIRNRWSPPANAQAAFANPPIRLTAGTYDENAAVFAAKGSFQCDFRICDNSQALEAERGCGKLSRHLGATNAGGANDRHDLRPIDRRQTRRLQRLARSGIERVDRSLQVVTSICRATAAGSELVTCKVSKAGARMTATAIHAEKIPPHIEPAIFAIEASSLDPSKAGRRAPCNWHHGGINGYLCGQTGSFRFRWDFQAFLPV